MTYIKAGLISFIILLLIIGCGTSKKSDDYGTESGTPINERIETLKEKVEDEPNNLDWRFQLSEAYQEEGRDLDALRTLEDGKNLDPSNADLKYEIGTLALKLGDKRKGYTEYKEILQGMDGDRYLNRIAPDFIDAYRVTPVIATANPEAFPSFSNDGLKIIYQMYENGNWDIYEYDLAAQATKKLVENPADEENPVYSPLMDFIAYTSTRDDFRDVDFNQKLRDIYIKNLSNGLETNLTTNSSNDWKPVFSQDGKNIIFVSERDDLRDLEFTDLHSNIYIMEKDGTFQLRLTETEANDGGAVMTGTASQLIYFDSNRNGKFGILKMNGDGTEQKLVTTNLKFNDVGPDVSSDGNKIVFFSDRDGNYEIYIMNTDGSNQQRLTSNPADDTNPVFYPDGNKILFHSNRSGNYDIYQLDLNSPSSTPPIYDVITKIDEVINSLN